MKNYYHDFMCILFIQYVSIYWLDSLIYFLLDVLTLQRLSCNYNYFCSHENEWIYLLLAVNYQLCHELHLSFLVWLNKALAFYNFKYTIWLIVCEALCHHYNLTILQSTIITNCALQILIQKIIVLCYVKLSPLI